MPGEGLAGQATAWWRLLSLLLRLRARRPLDGVLWCIPATLLHSGEQASAQGLMARRKFIDLLQRLGLSLPVYVVVTDMEEVAGFQELLAALEDLLQEIAGEPGGRKLRMRPHPEVPSRPGAIVTMGPTRHLRTAALGDPSV